MYKFKRIWRVLVAASAISVAPAASAHHSFAAVYDANSPVTITGVVTEVSWLNPHARFYVDVEADSGVIENWEFELGSPNGLMRIGWTRNSLKPGDVVTAEGTRARDGSPAANARSVTLADGTSMFAGDSQQGGLR